MCRGGGCGPGTPQTEFLQQGGVDAQLPEIVTDPITGISYYHLIVGNPADGFAQEVFIAKGYAGFQASSGSASSGAMGAILTNSLHFDGNSHDPLGVTGVIETGNGSANPTKVIVRQLLNDGELYQEFLKDKFDKKPRVTQMAFSEDINMFFDIDMRNSTYTDNTKAGAVTNTLTLEPSTSFLPEIGSGDFSMSTDQNGTKSIMAGGRIADTTSINITGGRYTWSGPAAGDGAYSYIEGSFDHTLIDWNQFFDASIGNLWTYGNYQPAGGIHLYNY